MIKKTSSNQSCGRDSEYVTGAFLKSFSIHLAIGLIKLYNSGWRVRLAPLNRFKPSSKIFYWLFQGGTSFVDLFMFFFSVLCLLCLCERLFICALWSPAGKGLISWLSFVVSNCEFVTFPLVSWVRCGTWLYRFLIFAPLLTLSLLPNYVLTLQSLGCQMSLL